MPPLRKLVLLHCRLRAGVCFAFDVTDCASIESESDGKVKHSDAGTEGEHVGGMCSHIRFQELANNPAIA